VGIFLAVQLGFVGPVTFEVIEIFQEQQPGGLLGVVEFGGASGFFAKDVVDIFEGLFEQSYLAAMYLKPNNLLWLVVFPV
jgi:hypothetical protein